MKTLKHKFVDNIPQILEKDVLYISIKYCTAVHKCICGCGNEVITPLSPTDWELIFNGKNVSLNPSIGNWSYDCKSHYWIIENKIKEADKWEDLEIERGRYLDENAKKEYYKRRKRKKNI